MHPHAAHHPSPRAARVSLAIHAGVYAVVNAVLAAINLSSGGEMWFQWPLLGWGLGLGYHAWIVSRHVGLGWNRDPSHSRNAP
jgi:hypothetical protein